MAKELPVRASIENLIYEVRGERVILDSDLAALYGVTTSRLMEQFKRNRNKFPSDFAYVLTKEEVAGLKSQNATSNFMNRSSSRNLNLAARGGRRKPHTVFTEHGAIMAATILNSEEAVAMSIFVVRAFVKMREVASQQTKWYEKLREVETALTNRMDGHEDAIQRLFVELKR